MGVWGLAVRLLLVMGICGSAWAGGNPEDIGNKKKLSKDLIPAEEASDASGTAEPSEFAETGFSGRADWIYKASDWVLNLYISRKGTRSQGSHGVLIFEGTEVAGTPGELRALPIGTVRYHGPEEARAHLWDDTGWQMVDPLVKPIVHEPADTVIPDGSRPDMEKLESDFEALEN
ncbi:MAG: hypothetical protein MI863_18720 [Desulfobacterales bacterium]|nr:hypothetical protein [Desulfobacterales bacterium]